MTEAGFSHGCELLVQHFMTIISRVKYSILAFYFFLNDYSITIFWIMENPTSTLMISNPCPLQFVVFRHVGWVANDMVDACKDRNTQLAQRLESVGLLLSMGEVLGGIRRIHHD